MKFIEWPSKGKFIPCPDHMKVVDMSMHQLTIRGDLPQEHLLNNVASASAKITFMSYDGKHLDRHCNISYRVEYKEKPAFYNRTKFGKGGIRLTDGVIYNLLQFGGRQ